MMRVHEEVHLEITVTSIDQEKFLTSISGPAELTRFAIAGNKTEPLRIVPVTTQFSNAGQSHRKNSPIVPTISQQHGSVLVRTGTRLVRKIHSCILNSTLKLQGTWFRDRVSHYHNVL